jgi:Outer membrane protein beta-barrel domain
MQKISILILVLLANNAFAQSSFRSSPFSSGFGMKGIHTYGGFGFADFTVQSPASEFRMDKGVFAFIGGERDINEAGTSVTISFNYMTTEGQALYNYSTLGGTNYTGSDIEFDSTNYQLGLGLKQRFFPNSWLRPYVEAGGLFGYHELKYSIASTQITVTGAGDPNGYKTKDALTGFGYYGEGGLEIDFSDKYGVKVGGRYQVTETRKFETLANQVLKFESFIFQLAFLLRF